MNEKNILINESIEFGWNQWKANFRFFIGFTIIIILASIFPDLIANSLKAHSKVLSSFVSFFAWIVSMFLGMGAVKISLLVAKDIKPRFIYLVTPMNTFLDYLVGVIIYTLIIMGGMLLLIVPGVILGIKYKYIPFLIIDKGFKPIEALHKSDEMTMNAKMPLFIFALLLIMLNVVGFFMFFVGLLITVPITWLAEVHVYNQLLSQCDNFEDIDEES